MPQIISKNSTGSMKLAVAIIISLIIGFLGGLYLGETGRLSLFTKLSVSLPGQTGAQKTEVKKGSYQEGYQVPLNFANDKLQVSGLMPIAGTGALQYLNNAKIKSINGSDIVVEFDASQLDTSKEGIVTKTIKVSNTVAITQQTQKSADELQKEYEEYQKKLSEMQKGTETDKTQGALTPPSILQPPTPYTIKELKISDLKEGDMLRIQTTTDISKTDILEASSVILITMPVIQELENPFATPPAGGTLIPPSAEPVVPTP